VSTPARGAPLGRQPIFNVPPGTLWTCGALIVCHVLFLLAGRLWQQAALDTFAFVPARFLAGFAVDGPGTSVLDLVPLISHAFLHADALHLLVNAGLLLAFGAAVERRLGGPRFLIVFAGGAVVGALAEALTGTAGAVYLIGASGAVYGLMAAALPILFRADMPGRRRRTVEFVAVVMGLNVIVAMIGLGDFLAAAEIAWRAHMGGFLAGLILGFALSPRRKQPK
jgi:membrane associated rhomboid family serine protease